jgi:c-di-GMP-binding flagellar brake protein YcgR
MKKDKKNSQTKKMTEQEAMERRRYMRFDLPVDMEYRTLTLNPIFGKALAQDLSKDGMRANLKHSVPKGTPVEICLNVPGDNLPVFVTGKVTWADGLEAGIRFTKIEHRDRARVMEYVYREWLKTNKNAGMASS